MEDLGREKDRVGEGMERVLEVRGWEGIGIDGEGGFGKIEKFRGEEGEGWFGRGERREFGEIGGKPIVLASNSIGKCQLVLS